MQQDNGRNFNNNFAPLLRHVVPQVWRFDVRFILKADDDAFVNVPALIAELKANCITPGCRHERMYFGREIRNNVVRAVALTANA